ncbi:MAG: amino acid ABC transporter permease [Ruminococcaceae bacterium]|nr:amino acid ABC transporter permease [Oscillospiraceae bacterium]MBQ9969461.1 amino acid ABC transporter permease [Oscillospiraceae bacterium]
MTIFSNMVKVVSRYWGLLLEGTANTLLLSALTVAVGIVIGAILALMRLSKFHIGKFKPLNAIATIYTEVVRDTPLLVQLYFFYFLIPMMFPGVDLGKVFSVALALCLNSGAYVAEIIRAGISAVDKGQVEAARSLGLNYTQTLQKVVFPQAIKNILPALCNEFVTIVKESSLASTFFVGDLMTQYKTINGTMYLAIEPLIIVSLIYFVLGFVLSKGVAAIERRMKND